MRILVVVCLAVLLGGPASADPDQLVYNPIKPTMAGQTITLTGKDLTIDQVVAVARYGAQVRLSPEARQRAADNYGLLLEAQAENVTIYRFNRGAGSGRAVVTLEGDPMSPENQKKIGDRQLAAFQRGPRAGLGPEVADEEIVRAMMVVRANAMTYAAASPQLMQILIDLLNHRITPVVNSRGTLGEGDLSQMTNVEGAMVGVGEAYFEGRRVKASDALVQAGLKPLAPYGADDDAMDVTNAYATAQAALLVADAGAALDWVDLIYAMDLDGMNSSVTPLGKPVQDARPFAPLNLDAGRVLDMIKGSYLFDHDPVRIVQDPESLRASSIRQGSAWKAWAALRATVITQMNSSDNNPAVRVGLSPKDSWELATPQFMDFYVKGGKYSNGKHGYVVSNANWDPYPLANDIEALTTAIANMDVAVVLRIDRFSSIFFTVIKPADVFSADEMRQAAGMNGAGYIPVDIWQDIQSLSVPVVPEGQAIIATVEDLQAQTRIKVIHARAVIDNTLHLLGYDLLNAAYWLDIRQRQDPKRAFGAAPTALWKEFRKTLPLFAEPAQRPERPIGWGAYEFLKTTAPTKFYPSGQPGFAAQK